MHVYVKVERLISSGFPAKEKRTYIFMTSHNVMGKTLLLPCPLHCACPPGCKKSQSDDNQAALQTQTPRLSLKTRLEKSHTHLKTGTSGRGLLTICDVSIWLKFINMDFFPKHFLGSSCRRFTHKIYYTCVKMTKFTL